MACMSDSSNLDDSVACRFITSFVTVFATVIAITKDLSDVEGDLKYNIKTFATQLGVRGVAFLGKGLLRRYSILRITWSAFWSRSSLCILVQIASSRGFLSESGAGWWQLMRSCGVDIHLSRARNAKQCITLQVLDCSLAIMLLLSY